MNYKKVFTESPDWMKELAAKARVLWIDGCTVHVYSPIFGEVAIQSNTPTKFLRGDTVAVKPSHGGINLEITENLTLSDIIWKYELATVVYMSEERKKILKQWQANMKQK